MAPIKSYAEDDGVAEKMGEVWYRHAIRDEGEGEDEAVGHKIDFWI